MRFQHQMANISPPLLLLQRKFGQNLHHPSRIPGPCKGTCSFVIIVDNVCIYSFPTTRICLFRSSISMSLARPRRPLNRPARSSSRITGMSQEMTRQGVTPCEQIGSYQNHGLAERYSSSCASPFQKDGNGSKVARPGSRGQIARQRYGLNSGKRSLQNRKSKQHDNGFWKSQSSKQLEPHAASQTCPQKTMSTSPSSTQQGRD